MSGQRRSVAGFGKRAQKELTAADLRTQAAYKNRWTTALHNPQLFVIAFFAS